MPARKQYLAGIISSYTVFCFGTAIGWSSPAEQFLVAQDAYNFTTTDEQWQWITSMLPLGTACWCLPMGALMNFHGGKTIMLFQLLPYIVACTLQIYANNIYMIYVARYLMGMCGAALCVAVPVYNVEISQSKRRGAMGSLFFGALTYGIICTNILTECFGLRIVNVINLVQASLCLTLKFIPESPSFYAFTGQMDKAHASLRWLRGNKYNLDAELRNLILVATRSEMNVHQTWWHTLKHNRIKRSLARTTTLLVLLQLSGGVVMSGYLHDILSELYVHEYKTFLMWLLLCPFLGHLMCFLLVDYLGRRPLLIFSTVLMSIMSIYLCYWFRWINRDSWHWQPTIAFCIFAFAYSIGIGPIAWIINVEVLVDPCRPYGCAFGATISWLVACLMTRCLCLCFAHHKIFYFLVVTSMTSFLFVLVFLPETKNLSMSEIQRRLVSPPSPQSSVDSF